MNIRAHHYSLFLKLAIKSGDNIKKFYNKWENLVRFEACLIKSSGKKNYPRLGPIIHIFIHVFYHSIR